MSKLTQGRVIAGKYRLEAPLGVGGMGAVWAARHLALDVRVAVKHIDPGQDFSTGARARFEAEARAAARLESPHVVQVRDYGVDDGLPYLVMELLEGEDLSTRLRRSPRLGMGATKRLAAEVCRGLGAAHAAGIVHRDIKPANLFCANVHGEEVVKILDFGLAKASGLGSVDDATRPGSILGTPHFMSPEQANGQPADHRSDLWSLAVVLYRCLTGRLPFSKDRLAELIVDIFTATIAQPSSLAAELPREVDAFFSRALARDPSHRFQSAKEMAEAFAALPQGDESAPSTAPLPPRRGDFWHNTLALDAAPKAATPAGGSLSPAHRSVAPRLARPRRASVALLALAMSGLGGGLAALTVGRVARPAAEAASAAAEAPPSGEPAREIEAPEVASALPSASAEPTASAARPIGSAPRKPARPAPKPSARPPSMFGF